MLVVVGVLELPEVVVEQEVELQLTVVLVLSVVAVGVLQRALVVLEVAQQPPQAEEAAAEYP